MYADIDVKITKVRGLALSSPYGDGKVFGQPMNVKSIGLIEISTESGLKGIGETYAGVYAPELVAPIAAFLESFVVGRTVGDDSIIRQLTEIPFIGRNGVLRSMISAIEIAIWDLRGKLLDKPVYSLLGATKQKIQTYASGGSVVLSPDEIRKDVEVSLVKGFNAYKMRVGRQDWALDLQRVAVAREMLGQRLLMVDAIMGTLRPPWDAKTATARACDLEPFELRWLEEPVYPEDISALAEVRRDSPVPIAAGEAYSGWGEYQAILNNQAVDILQFDATHSGGIDICRSLAKECGRRRLDAAVHVWGSAVAISANAHLALACSEISILEIPMIPLDITEHMWVEAPQLKEGYYQLSDAPGLGVELTRDLETRYALVPGSGYRLPSG